MNKGTRHNTDMRGGAPARMAHGGYDFGERVQPLPADGNYVREPARADERGVVGLPPPVPDPLPKVLAGVCLALAAGGMVTAVVRRGGAGVEGRTNKGRTAAGAVTKGARRRLAAGRDRA